MGLLGRLPDGSTIEDLRALTEEAMQDLYARGLIFKNLVLPHSRLY